VAIAEEIGNIDLMRRANMKLDKILAML
jgi:hypothetical protein